MPNRPGTSRRRFLKLFGAAVVGAGAAAPVLTTLLDRNKEVKAAHSEPSRRLRHWAMAFDLRRCDGCQSQGKPPMCTAACIEGHFIPVGQQWLEVFEYELSGGGTQFVPAPCMQCQNAPCVSVCPVGATWTTPEGITLIDQQRCIGCRLCMAACPYGRRFFNWGEPVIPPEAHFVEYSVEHQMPAKKGTVMKCSFCSEWARAGRLPFCVLGCPNKAIYYGDLEEDVATNTQELVTFSEFLSTNQAYNLKEDLKTKPRVFYIPGHGQLVGRNPNTHGRLPTVWPWAKE